MSYYIIHDENEELNRFKKYDAIDMNTLMKVQLGGGVINKERERGNIVNDTVFENFNYQSGNLRVHVQDNVLYVYSRGMSYIVSNVEVRYVYQCDRVIHVGVKGVPDHEVVIDMVKDRVRYFSGMKAVTYEDNIFERALPKRLINELGLCYA